MKSAGFLVVAALFAGCTSSPWSNYGPSMYSVLKDPSVETTQAHFELLGRVIQNARDGGRKPPPGMQAEYAYYATRLGRPEEAKQSIEAEAKDYPEARTFLVLFGRYLATVAPITTSTESVKGASGQ